MLCELKRTTSCIMHRRHGRISVACCYVRALVIVCLVTFGESRLGLENLKTCDVLFCYIGFVMILVFMGRFEM